jgi:hypothetical protein
VPNIYRVIDAPSFQSRAKKLDGWITTLMGQEGTDAIYTVERLPEPENWDEVIPLTEVDGGYKEVQEVKTPPVRNWIRDATNRSDLIQSMNDVSLMPTNQTLNTPMVNTSSSVTSMSDRLPNQSLIS